MAYRVRGGLWGYTSHARPLYRSDVYHLLRIEWPSLPLHTTVAEFAMQEVVGGGIIEGDVFHGRTYGAAQAGRAQVAQAVHSGIGGYLLHSAARGNHAIFLRR